MFLSASETHNKKNVNKTIAETLDAFDEVVPPARAAGVPVRAYVSTVFGCPYEGDVDPERAVELTGQLRDMGVYQVSLGDTIGVANPRQVEDVLGARARRSTRADAIAVHFHDTQGTALANCLVALTAGHHDDRRRGRRARRLPVRARARRATSRPRTSSRCCTAMGVETGIDLDKLVEASRIAATFVGHELPSKYLKAHLGKQARARRRAENA